MSNQVNCQDNSNGNGLQQAQSNVKIVQYETTPMTISHCDIE